MSQKKSGASAASTPRSLNDRLPSAVTEHGQLLGALDSSGGLKMHGVKDIVEEATQLPVDERVIVVDSLLRTLNVPNPEIDKAWAEVAEARLAELRSGRVKAVPGGQVFGRIKDRFARRLPTSIRKPKRNSLRPWPSMRDPNRL